MNADVLLKHFDRISEAPDAVARLRRFILDLAVRGKLVEQDSNEEPATELLKRISAINGLETVAQWTTDDPPPFSLPFGWLWSRIGLITTKTGSGSTPRGGQSVYKSAGVPFLRSQNVYNDGLRLNDVAYIDQSTHMKMRGTAVEPGDLLLNITGGSIGRCCLIPNSPIEANISQHVAIIRPATSRMCGFLHKAVLSPFFQSYVIGEQTGAGRGGLPKNRMDQIPVPVPPLAEQHRIIAKVDELMALCDLLEAAKNEREARRDRLVAASLHRIGTSPTAEDKAQTATALRHATRFHLDHLPRLTTSPEHIKQLRQTILNLAVRGRLVPQDPNDEPVNESEPLIEMGKNLPHELPINWTWRSIKALTDLVTDGEHATPTRIPEHEIPLVTAKNVRDGEMDYTVTDWVSFETAEKAWKRCRPLVGDILLVCVGATTGRLCVLREPRDMVLVRSVALIRPSSIIDADYFALAIRSPIGQSQIWSSVKVAAQPCLYINRINALAIPLPPLAEQQRIVAKVGELMALCDQLETQLANSEADSRRLLEAVLHDALAVTT